MTRAEIAALKSCPVVIEEHTECDINKSKRLFYIKGYEQAEKDTIERACDMLMNYVFEEVTPEMRDHFRKAMEDE